MERRIDERLARRVPVRFWQRGDSRSRQGYTANISKSGMFISSNIILSPGMRVRIEVLDPHRGFMVEGEVARSVRVAPHLHSIKQGGMGIRFLPVEQLVLELFPTTEAQSSMVDGGGEASRSGVKPPASGFVIRFESWQQLADIYDRDVGQGGLMISTNVMPELGKVVTIEIHLPDGDPVQLQARVVHRVEPEPDGAPNLLAGIGVQFLEPERAKTQLMPPPGH